MTSIERAPITANEPANKNITIPLIFNLRFWRSSFSRRWLSREKAAVSIVASMFSFESKVPEVESESCRCAGAGRLVLKRSEEFRGHHFRGTFDHSLAHSGNRAADLQLSRIRHQRAAVLLDQIKVGDALRKSHQTFALDYDAVMRGREHVFQAHLAAKGSFDRANAGFQNRFVMAAFGQRQRLAAGNASFENFRIDEGKVDAFAWRGELLGAFDLHQSSKTIRRLRRLRRNETVGQATECRQFRDIELVDSWFVSA